MRFDQAQHDFQEKKKQETEKLAPSGKVVKA